jgi:hypothetical protein
MQNWIGSGESARGRKEKMCQVILELAQRLKEFNQNQPKPAEEEDW